MTPSDAKDDLSPVLIALLRGVLQQDEYAALWQKLLDVQARAREYVAVLGLELMVDEAEGYAYLRQRPTADGETPLPRLIPKRQLSYPVSLLLALLRKRLAEFDVLGGDTRLILSRENLVDMLRVFLPASANEARLMDRVDSDITRVIEMGFLRRLQGQEERFEVRRVLKAFVDAQWLHDFDSRLAEYRAHLSSSSNMEEATGEKT